MRRLACIAILLITLGAAPAFAQTREHFCAVAGDAGKVFETGDGLAVAELIGARSLLLYANLVPAGGKLDLHGGNGFGEDGLLRFSFRDGYGAPGTAIARREGDTLSITLTRTGPALQGERPEKARNYGALTLTKAACGGRIGYAFGSTDYYKPSDLDLWRYRSAGLGRAPSAELFSVDRKDERAPSVLFRVSCRSRGRELLFEYFPGEDPRKWVDWARKTGIDLIFPGTGEGDGEIFHAIGPLTRQSVTGRLAMTDKVRRLIAESPTILLYGENGPTNNTNGGEALALRRVVAECAAR